MKTSILSTILLVCVIAVSPMAKCQENSDATGGTLFEKGTWLINLHKPLSFTTYVDKYDNVKYKYSDFRLNLEDYYFFHNNMGVGFNLDYSRSVSDINSKDIKNSTTLYASYLQGFDAGGLDFLAKIGVGIGKSKDVDKLNETDVISNLIKLKFEVGPVIELFDSKSILLQPTVGFLYDFNSFRNYRENSFDFAVRANLIFNLGSGDFNCDSKSNFEDSHLRFARGMNSFSGSTMADLKFGGFMQKYDDFKNKYMTNSQSLMFNYRHYIMDDLSIGAWTDIRNSYQSQTGTGTSNNSRTTDFLIGPGITWNLPFGKCWENTFVDLNAGLGESIDKTYSFKTKGNIFGGLIQAGYDYGISKNLSMVPAIGFKTYWYRYSDDTNNYNEHGPIFSLGMRASF